jgi:hypothetical protein
VIITETCQMCFKLYTVTEFEINLTCTDLIKTVCSKDFNHLLVQTLKDSPISVVSMSHSLKVFMCSCLLMTKKLNSMAFSPQANYTDRATAACWRSYCQLLRIEGVTWSVQWIPMAVNFGFLDQSRYFSIQVTPQLSSRGWVDPVPDPLLRKSANDSDWKWD